MTSRIEDYALIGDCETAALVRRDGSIDWLCWPRFDSDACFASLLGTPENGRWLLAPSDAAQVSRRYRDDTLILETRFETQTGSVLVIDFMPPRGCASDLIRVVVGESGEVRMHTELVIRFGYSAFTPWVNKVGENVWRAVAGPDMVLLATRVPLRGEDTKSVAEFTVRAGEREAFVMTYSPSHLQDPQQPDVEHALRDTEAFWTEWASKARIRGRLSDAVMRSLITLRALIYSPTGIAPPVESWPRRPRHCPNSWVAPVIGTTAFAGCAMRP